MRLAEAVDALLDPHRVPRHGVIHERAAELEVQALDGGVRAEQYVGFPIRNRRFASSRPIRRQPPPGAGISPPHPEKHIRRGPASPRSACEPRPRQVALAARPRPQCLPQKVHGVGELGEHHRLREAGFVQLAEHVLQAVELAVGRPMPSIWRSTSCASSAASVRHSSAAISSASGISSMVSSSGASSSEPASRPRSSSDPLRAGRPRSQEAEGPRGPGGRNVRALGMHGSRLRGNDRDGQDVRKTRRSQGIRRRCPRWATTVRSAGRRPPAQIQSRGSSARTRSPNPPKYDRLVVKNLPDFDTS